MPTGLFHHTFPSIITSWQSANSKGYPCLCEHGCRYNRTGAIDTLISTPRPEKAFKYTSHCETHFVFLATLSTIRVTLHHCQGVLAVTGYSAWSNRALCGARGLFLPLCRHEFISWALFFLTWNLTALERSKPKTQSSKAALNSQYS